MIRFSFRVPFTSVRLSRRGVSFPLLPFVRASANWPGAKRRRARRRR